MSNGRVPSTKYMKPQWEKNLSSVEDNKKRQDIEDQKKKEIVVKHVSNELINLIKKSINTNEYMFMLSIQDRKIKEGTVVINLSIANKVTEARKYLSFSVIRDNYSGLLSVIILSVRDNTNNILFSTFERDPVKKLEKFVPTIIHSTEAMIKVK